MNQENGLSLNLTKRTKRIIIFLIVAAAAAIVVFSVHLALKQHEIEPLNNAFYYSQEDKVDMASSAVLKRDEGVTTIRVNKKTSYSLKGYMILEDGGKTIVFQDDMLWYNFETNSLKRIDYFSRLTYKGDTATYKKKHSEKTTKGGFLYDNKDSYVILEKATITWNNLSETIEPMTIICSDANMGVQIIRPDGRVNYLDNPGQDFSVKFSNGCVLQPVVDTIYQVNGSWRLLFTTVSMVPEL